MAFARLRTGLWHLRKGGLSQFRQWRRRVDLGQPLTTEASSDTAAIRRGFDPLSFSPLVANKRKRTFGSLRVAAIMDDFSRAAWSSEFDLIPVTPNGWRDEIAAGIDFLFVESAWAGNDKAWQFQLLGANSPSDALQALVAHCREAEIPTVFWNKEDPPHFEDFIKSAALFDYIFTTDSNMIPGYKERLGHDRIFPLAFAAQPAIHNPIRIKDVERTGDVAFAGMYFAHKFPERRAQMDTLLGAAAAVSPRMAEGLTIYSRFAGHDKKYQFPKPFDKYVVGSLPYEKMLTAYRGFKVFLNVNSVTDSPSMCARRVFEIAASGTPVVSARSEAIPRYFAQDEVPIVDTRPEAANTLRALVNSKELRDRIVHRAQRRIWNEHTFTHRAADVLTRIGIDFDRSRVERANVTAMVPTNRPDQIDHVLEQVSRQEGVNVELALLTHGFDIDPNDFKARAKDMGLEATILIQGDKTWSLGTCLNALVAASSGDYLAKIDDDDIYGPHYLLDQSNALRYSGADIVGKQATYLYLSSQDTLLLRSPEQEHQWTTFVAGPTLVGERQTFTQFPFADVTRGEDSDLLRRIVEADGRVYSADRFNFVQVRGAQHTWNVHDHAFLATGRVETFGLNPKHVLV